MMICIYILYPVEADNTTPPGCPNVGPFTDQWMDDLVRIKR